MDFELRRAREKLEKEQKERREKAKSKLEKENKAKAEASRRREAIESVQRSRRIDAAEAQLKAEEHMAESLLAGQGIVFSHILEAVPYQGLGDKIKLPPSCFKELSDEGAFDKGPLYFRLSVVHQDVSLGKKENHRMTHAGVLEFTAEEGSVALSPHVWSNLFSEDAPFVTLIEVQYVKLPKGSYAKLQPQGIGFLDVPNHKAVLETSLRQHATLSQDDIITVRHGEFIYKLHVLELKPSSSVSVLETDVEVDIVNPDSSSEMKNEHVLKPLKVGVAESGAVEEGQYMYYKFSVESGEWGRIAAGKATLEVRLDAETNDGDTDLFISKHPLVFPTQHQHQWSSHDLGSKVFILSSKHENFGLGTYSIGIFGFKGKTEYKISVNVQDNSNRNVGQQATLSTLAMNEDTIQCRNCKHYIPSRRIVLHEAYCSRHNIVCQHPGCGIVLRVGEAKDHVHCNKCGNAFLQAELEKHIKVFHEPAQCPCGVFLEKERMVQHQSTDCPMRLITCRFCGDIVPAGSSPMDARDRLRGLSEHESVCGSRTAPCASCGRSVMLKEMDIHQIAVHQKS